MKKLPVSGIFFLCAAVITISILSVVSALSLYDNIESLLIDEKGKKAMSVTVAVAKLVEQDYPSFQKLLETDDYADGNYDAVYYAKMQLLFRDIREKSDVKYLYCGKRISEDRMIYLFDGEDPNSKLFSPIGSEDDLGETEQALYGRKSSGFTSIIDYPDWGRLLTGMTPIIDPSTGEAVAHVGADVSVNSINTSLSDVKDVLLFNSLLFTIITTLIIYLLLRMTSSFMETDYLTGLRSKSFQDRFLKQQIKKSIAGKKQFLLIMLDFDDFKLINDEYGHQFGDKVLKSVSDIIKISARSVDCCSRYGGDEFIIILPEANPDYALMICQWLQKEVSGLKLTTKNGDSVPVSVSIGIALWEMNMTAEQIMIQADKALYHSKRSGKNRIVFYTDDLE